jgi:hypothetical protein
MISITDAAGRRIYTVPRGLVAAAQRLFKNRSKADAIHALARQVSADRFASLAAIAENDIDQAVACARKWLTDTEGPMPGNTEQTFLRPRYSERY